jgi:hypothetical protein
VGSVIELTEEEQNFLIWALSYIEGVASEMDDLRTGKQAYTLAEKLKRLRDK